MIQYLSLKLTHLPTNQVCYTTYVRESIASALSDRTQVVKEIAESDDHDPEDYVIAEPLGQVQDNLLNLTRDDWKTMTDNLLESYNYHGKAWDLIPQAYEYIPKDKIWKYYGDILKFLHQQR